jgi:hypothetical protein
MKWWWTTSKVLVGLQSSLHSRTSISNPVRQLNQGQSRRWTRQGVVPRVIRGAEDSGSAKNAKFVQPRAARSFTDKMGAPAQKTRDECSSFANFNEVSVRHADFGGCTLKSRIGSLVVYYCSPTNLARNVQLQRWKCRLRPRGLNHSKR